MVPSPYGVRWTSKLIFRDLRGLAAGYTNKFRSLFSSAAADASASTSRIQVEEVEIEPPIDTEDAHDAAPTSSESSSSSFSAIDGDSTAFTEVTEMSLEASNTSYGLLCNKLKELYTSRVRDLPLNDRWVFRGAWLLLSIATQYCASNPSYDILRGESSRTNEASLLLEMLQYSLSKPLNPHTPRVSQVPAMPYTKSNEDTTRRDSVFSFAALEHAQCHAATNSSELPSPALLWFTVFAGATDRTKTVQAAEYLLGHVWPEKDATAMLKVVGDPTKRLSGDEDTELRNALGRMLFPEYSGLC